MHGSKYRNLHGTVKQKGAWSSETSLFQQHRKSHMPQWAYHTGGRLQNIFLKIDLGHLANDGQIGLVKMTSPGSQTARKEG